MFAHSPCTWNKPCLVVHSQPTNESHLCQGVDKRLTSRPGGLPPFRLLLVSLFEKTRLPSSVSTISVDKSSRSRSRIPLVLIG